MVTLEITDEQHETAVRALLAAMRERFRIADDMIETALASREGPFAQAEDLDAHLTAAVGMLDTLHSMSWPTPS